MHGQVYQIDKPDSVPPQSVKLLDQLRERVRYPRDSVLAKKVNTYWD